MIFLTSRLRTMTLCEKVLWTKHYDTMNRSLQKCCTQCMWHTCIIRSDRLKVPYRPSTLRANRCKAITDKSVTKLLVYNTIMLLPQEQYILLLPQHSLDLSHLQFFFASASRPPLSSKAIIIRFFLISFPFL